MTEILVLVSRVEKCVSLDTGTGTTATRTLAVKWVGLSDSFVVGCPGSATVAAFESAS